MSSSNCIIFGLHAVTALLNSQPERIIRLCLQQQRHDKKIAEIESLAKKLDIVTEQLAKRELDGLTDHASHQGIVAICKQPHTYSEADLATLLRNTSTPPFVLILDGVQDPHNLGACIRSANAAGVHAIIIPKDKSVGLTATVSKVASGAADVTPVVQVTNLVRALEDLKTRGIWTYGAAAEAEKSLFQTSLAGPIALVLGAEGAGLRRLTREHCDVLIKIPMFGSVASLNVSVAAGICLFEIVRQRHMQISIE